MTQLTGYKGSMLLRQLHFKTNIILRQISLRQVLRQISLTRIFSRQISLRQILGLGLRYFYFI